MTREEKARAYDEALIRGSRLWESDMITRENYEYIFPELKESEDARIRKEMIEILRKEAQDFPSSVIAEKSNSWIAWLEKQDEQKLADKVSLNFKKGDILYEQKTMSILLVYERNGSWLMTFCDYWMLKEKFHVEFPYENYGFVREMSLVPATKEQRDLLFQKMKEAGYEWDAEKKELKKIVTPIFHIGDRVRYKGHACDGVITEITDTDYICGNAKLPISTQDNLEIVEQNSAWSEEDENNYDISLKIMCASNKSEELINKLYDWFKSLKYRVQPKQEWSEEDESRIDNLCHFLEEYGNQYYGHLTLLSTISWLKSLKDRVQPQSQWKPSYEQIYALRSVVTELKHSDYKYQKVIEDLYNGLKKLYE